MDIKIKHIRIKNIIYLYTFDKMDGHTCNICNKIYASYKSLWNHINKFHINDVKNKFKLSQESAESKHKVSIK